MAAAPVPSARELEAPAHWRTIDLISDLHLQAAAPATFQAWQHYLATTAADAVLMLGDLFEVWVGDDVLDVGRSFEARCAQLLQQAAARAALYVMHGNRDFLLGPAFARHCRLSLLDDPTVLVFDRQRWLLTHGDALCTDDTDYLRFRAEVRSAEWQRRFLSRPLPERQALARGLREQSEARKASGAVYADVDPALACRWLQAAQATTLIHGHTHRPGDHALPCGDGAAAPPHALQRIVLSDWDAEAQAPRLQVLRLRSGQVPQRVDLCAH